jgi:hypothetical protein
MLHVGLAKAFEDKGLQDDACDAACRDRSHDKVELAGWLRRRGLH